ncbi:MAG: YihY/virulence factor BrkB family protein [Monoglobales bacterium]
MDIILKIRAFFKSMVERYATHDVAQTAGQIAYFGFLSIFPFIVFVNFILHKLNLSGVNIKDLMSPAVPHDIIDLLSSYVTYVSEQNSLGVLSIGIISTIYLASRVIRSMELSVSKAYGTPTDRPFFKSIAISITAIICIGLMVVVAVMFVVFGKKPLELLLSFLSLSEMVGVILFLKWAFVIFVMLMVFALIYWITPNKKTTFAEVVPGTIFSLICFIALSSAFGWYFGYATSSSSIYGYIGTVFVALVWIYFVGVIFIIGAEMNAYFDSLTGKNEKKT